MPEGARPPLPQGPGPVVVGAYSLDPDLGETRSFLAGVRDNLEAIAFALVLALLLRHFCIEVFKIPTASMEPTLFGDGSATHPGTAGDRIIVDKLAYIFHGPNRWDVAVFHYPLDWSRNFIKRVAVLPDEVFQLLRGDVWIAEPPPEGQPPRFHPARKPRRVREQLYVPVWPAVTAMELARAADFWRPEANETGRWRVASATEFAFEAGPDARPGAEAEGVLKWGYQVTDSMTAKQAQSTSGYTVSDVRFQATVLASGPSDLEILWKPGDGRQQVLRLCSEGRAPSVLRTKESEYTLGRALRTQHKTTVELESVDGDVHAWVDGDEVKVVADELAFSEVERQAVNGQAEAQELSITARGGPLTLSDIRLDRDVYYRSSREESNHFPSPGEPGRTASDEYFMLGDNTQHSSDSRVWTAHGQALTDGTTVWWDPSPSLPTPGLRHTQRNGAWGTEVTDVEGIVRWWADADAVGGSLTKRMPFVTRDRIVGRAFFALVFWPFDDAFLERIRFIH